MKKVSLAVLTFLLVGGVCHADMPSAPVSAAGAMPAVTVRALTGKVKSVSTGADATLLVIDGLGATTSLQVLPTAAIVDPKGAKITLDQVKANARVSVQYATTKAGVKAATAIKVLQ